MQNKLNRSALSALVAAMLVAPVGAEPMADEAALQLLQRVNQLEQELRNLRGDNEKLQNELDTVRKSQTDNFQQVDERLEKLQDNGSATPSTDKTADKPADPNAPVIGYKTDKDEANAEKPAKADPNGFYSYGSDKSDDKNPTLTNKPEGDKPAEGDKPEGDKSAEGDKPEDDKPALDKTEADKESKPAESATTTSTGDTKALPEQDERSSYDDAFQTLLQDPKEAIPEFRTFLKNYPKSPLASSAQYWVGEALYAEKDFKAAIEEFLVVLKEHKGSDKAPDAALKLGYSFYELKEWEKARKTLEDVISFFPDNAETSKMAKERLEKMKTEGH